MLAVVALVSSTAIPGPSLEFCSPISCDDLGWEDLPRSSVFATAHPASSTNNVCGQTHAGCHVGATTQRGAAEYCNAMGARLCTEGEYTLGEVAQTGCRLDSEFVWTGSKCGVEGRSFIAIRQTKEPSRGDGNKVYKRCLDDIRAQEFVFGGRCCADTRKAPCSSLSDSGLPDPNLDPETFSHGSECHSPMSCDELGWHDEPLVNLSPFPLYKDVCGQEVSDCDVGVASYNEASDYCKAIGARLCTEQEYSSGEAVGSGCSLDKQYVWTSGGAGGVCPPNYFVAVRAGKKHGEARHSCESAAGGSRKIYGGRCCADTGSVQCRTLSPTEKPSQSPTTRAPSVGPSGSPTREPSASPSRIPTAPPSTSPTPLPTREPTSSPSSPPTHSPSPLPTDFPTITPTETPSTAPSASPSTDRPSLSPSPSPSTPPSHSPTVILYKRACRAESCAAAGAITITGAAKKYDFEAALNAITPGAVIQITSYQFIEVYSLNVEGGNLVTLEHLSTVMPGILEVDSDDMQASNDGDNKFKVRVASDHCCGWIGTSSGTTDTAALAVSLSDALGNNFGGDFKNHVFKFTQHLTFTYVEYQVTGIEINQLYSIVMPEMDVKKSLESGEDIVAALAKEGATALTAILDVQYNEAYKVPAAAREEPVAVGSVRARGQTEENILALALKTLMPEATFSIHNFTFGKTFQLEISEDATLSASDLVDILPNVLEVESDVLAIQPGLISGAMQQYEVKVISNQCCEFSKINFDLQGLRDAGASFKDGEVSVGEAFTTTEFSYEVTGIAVLQLYSYILPNENVVASLANSGEVVRAVNANGGQLLSSIVEIKIGDHTYPLPYTSAPSAQPNVLGPSLSPSIAPTSINSCTDCHGTFPASSEGLWCCLKRCIESVACSCSTYYSNSLVKGKIAEMCGTSSSPTNAPKDDIDQIDYAEENSQDEKENENSSNDYASTNSPVYRPTTRPTAAVGSNLDYDDATGAPTALQNMDDYDDKNDYDYITEAPTSDFTISPSAGPTRASEKFSVDFSPGTAYFISEFELMNTDCGSVDRPDGFEFLAGYILKSLGVSSKSVMAFEFVCDGYETTLVRADSMQPRKRRSMIIRGGRTTNKAENIKAKIVFKPGSLESDIKSCDDAFANLMSDSSDFVFQFNQDMEVYRIFTLRLVYTRVKEIVSSASPSLLPTALPTSSNHCSILSEPSSCNEFYSILDFSKCNKDDSVCRLADAKKACDISPFAQKYCPRFCNACPTATPTASPTRGPTTLPTESPTGGPTKIPTNTPSNHPSKNPTTASPTTLPSLSPTGDEASTFAPPSSPPATPPTTELPSLEPTEAPSADPTNPPSAEPTNPPSAEPTNPPSAEPTNPPSKIPPTNPPSAEPTNQPSKTPSAEPTEVPSAEPSISPTGTDDPTPMPSEATNAPTLVPTGNPTAEPSTQPSPHPSAPPASPIMSCDECKDPYNEDGSNLCDLLMIFAKCDDQSREGDMLRESCKCTCKVPCMADGVQSTCDPNIKSCINLTGAPTVRPSQKLDNSDYDDYDSTSLSPPKSTSAPTTVLDDYEDYDD